MTMKARVGIAAALAIALIAATGGFSMQMPSRPDIENGKKNVAGKVKFKEWLVRYDPDEAVEDLFPRAKRDPDAMAIRLRIVKVDGSYYARLWRFKVNNAKTAYVLSDKTDTAIGTPIPLTITPSVAGRQRRAFKSEAVPLHNGAGDPTGAMVTINGIWQLGHGKSRAHDRIQLKLHVTRAAEGDAATKQAAPVFGSGCEEDPDTDVLEEGDPPPGDEDDEPPPLE